MRTFYLCFIPLGDGRSSRKQWHNQKSHRHSQYRLLSAGLCSFPLEPQPPPLSLQVPLLHRSNAVRETEWPSRPTTMLKKMTHKFTHFHAPKRSNQLDQPQLPATVPYYTEHRASISTQRTSLSEWSKREDSMESTRSTLQKRPKAPYSIQDFVVHRTLGTGSFGRVHLGKIVVSHRVWTT